MTRKTAGSIMVVHGRTAYAHSSDQGMRQTCMDQAKMKWGNRKTMKVDGHAHAAGELEATGKEELPQEKDICSGRP